MPATKIAIVTGAGRGLGRSMAQHLARAGVGVIGSYRDRQGEADPLVADIQFAGGPGAVRQLDVGKSQTFAQFSAEVQTLLAGFGRDRFDYLVNNAGFGVYAAHAETTEEQVDELFCVNVKGPLFLTQALLPLMADGGRILNVSSGVARFTGPGYAAYAAAKGAIEVLTRYQAKELGERQVRVNTLVPGAVATDFGGGLVRDNEHDNDMVASVIALGRVGVADDIGAAVPAILSDSLG